MSLIAWREQRSVPLIFVWRGAAWSAGTTGVVGDLSVTLGAVTLVAAGQANTPLPGSTVSKRSTKWFRSSSG